MSPQEWNTVVSVNLNSAFYMTRLVTPDMVQKRDGRIINMSSVAGKPSCDIVAAHYAATKAALIGATQIGRASCWERVCQYVYLSLFSGSLTNHHTLIYHYAL